MRELVQLCHLGHKALFSPDTVLFVKVVAHGNVGGQCLSAMACFCEGDAERFGRTIQTRMSVSLRKPISVSVMKNMLNFHRLLTYTLTGNIAKVFPKQ